ncbi:MAG TPA: AEC family transporter [Deltaproteobacteria bacterium]|nr:AEC family transporter [Deltaproteobacteria bacterium]
MSTSLRFILFQLFIIIPFLAGTRFRSRVPEDSGISRRLIRLNLIFIEPCIALWSIWGLDLSRDLAFLPLSGLFLALAGMAAGWSVLTAMPLERRSRASFLISSSIANHGFTMGAFICYLFLGERGLGLAFIFLSYFLIFVFTVIFPYADSVSSRHSGRRSTVWQYLFDLQNMPLFAILLALVLKAIHIPRPSILFPMDALMAVSISIYYFSMGMSFTTSEIFSSLKPNVALFAIKFVAVPAAMVCILAFVSLDPKVEGVIRIQSFMPAAIYSVIASVLFDLDTKLSSDLFVINTVAFLIFVLPLLFLFKGYILGI